ncbi:MAG: pilus assembly protein [Pirellulaceae bacterium]
MRKFQKTGNIPCTRYGVAKRAMRSGAVAVEFAMMAPLMFFLLFGALELSHANMVYNSTEAAAYEGARQGIVPGATAADCINAAQGVLDITGVSNATIEVTPADLSIDTATVEVRIRVPYAQNTIVAPMFTKTLQIDRNCALTRERL